MDVLSHLINSVGLNPSILAQATIPKPWGVRFPTSRAPAFHILIRGNCWLRSVELEAPIRLEAGDLIFVSGQLRYDLVSDLAIEAIPIRESMVTWHHGQLPESEAVSTTTFMCGIYQFALEPIHPFFAELPTLIHLPSHQIAAHEPMYSALRLLSAELAFSDGTPGKSALIDRLVDVMFYYILRQWMKTHQNEGASWTCAFRDPHLRKVLVAVHEDIAHPWQVEVLAQKAGLSRAAFSQRFKQLLGDTPINYVAKVRIQKAMELLVKTEETIERIAENVGYSTGFALSKAFKRIGGMSPQQFRQQVLNVPQVDSSFQQVGGKTMPKHAALVQSDRGRGKAL